MDAMLRRRLERLERHHRRPHASGAPTAAQLAAAAAALKAHGVQVDGAALTEASGDRRSLAASGEGMTTMAAPPDWTAIADAAATLPKLPDATRQWLMTRAAEQSLYEFVRQAWPHTEAYPFVDGWHIRAICTHLQAVTEGTIDNLLINVPPGTGKSLLVCVFWPAWEWLRDPACRWLCAAYDQRLSTRDAVRCRHLLSSPWYRQRWGDRVRLVADQNQKAYYQTDRGGVRCATAVGSYARGEHPDRIICDDANANGQSTAERERVIAWWQQAISTRGVARHCRRVVIQQRLHEQDLSGYLLAQGGYQHICLPMRYEPDRMRATALGWTDERATSGQVLLCEQLFDERQVAAMEANLGSYATAGQLQQRPAPADGGIFKRAWLARRYRAAHGSFWLGGQAVHASACRRFATVDLAVSMKTSADYTVIAVWCVDPQGRLIWADLVRERLEGPDIVPRIQAKVAQWDLSYVGIEASGFQLSIVQQARRAGLAVRELKADKDKVARALAATVRLEGGQVWLPEQAPWLGAVEHELLTFPHGEHDDVVDVLAYACLEMARPGPGSAPRASGGFGWIGQF